MFRLLRAEGYKIRKSRSFYICVIVMAAFVFLLYGMLSLADGIQKGKIENGTAGVVISRDGKQVAEGSGSIWDEVGIFDMLQQLFSGDMAAIVLAVYVSIVVISEYSSGMLKNVVGKGSSRAVVYLSKLFSATAASILITLTGIIAVLAGGMLFIGKDAFAGDVWQNLLAYSGLQLLLTAALAAVYVLVGEAARNLAAGISVGIGITVLPVLLLAGLDAACEKYGIAPSQYWLVSRSENCPFSGFTANYVMETVLVAAVWFLAAAGIGIWHFCRTDIK